MEKVAKVENGLIEGIIYKQLLIFFFPILYGALFQQLYNIADAIIIGNFAGKEALASVGGTTATLINLLIGFFSGLSAGASVVISHYYGSGDKEQVSKSVHTAIALGLTCGGILTIIGLFGAPIVLKIMNVPDEIMKHSLIYIKIYFMGFIPVCIYNISTGILRAVGDSKRPLRLLLMTFIMNICLDILFVAIFKWGIVGVATATVLSQTTGAIMTSLILIKSNASYRLIIRNINYSKNNLMHMIKIGIPAGIQSVFYALSNLVIQSQINQFGTNVIIATTIFEKMEGLFWTIMGVSGVAITTFVGQNFGAKKYDRINKSMKITLSVGIGIAISFSIVLSLFGRVIFRVFTDDIIAIQIGMDILYITVPFYFFFVFIEVLSGVLRGTGNSVVPSVITGIGVCLLRVIWLIIAMPFAKDIRTIMISYPMSWVVAAIMIVIYYKKSGWIKGCMPIT